MILLGLGGNLPHSRYGCPRSTLAAALDMLNHERVRTLRSSAWYASAPVPDDGSPHYTNAVARVQTDLAPAALLRLLLEVEARFGRVRTRALAPRPIDLDLLAYDGLCTWGAPTVAGQPVLPHPRLHERAFVLVPLVEIAADWRHPAFGRTAKDLLAVLPPGQKVARLP